MLPHEELPEEHLKYIRRNLAAVCSLRRLNLGEPARLLISLLITETRPYSVSALAEATGYSRKTVRTQLSNGAQYGTCEFVDGGWVLTPLGRTLMNRLMRETLEIAEGTRGWYSEELVGELIEPPAGGPVTRRFEDMRGRVVA